MWSNKRMEHYLVLCNIQFKLIGSHKSQNAAKLIIIVSWMVNACASLNVSLYYFFSNKLNGAHTTHTIHSNSIIFISLLHVIYRLFERMHCSMRNFFCKTVGRRKWASGIIGRLWNSVLHHSAFYLFIYFHQINGRN